MPGNLRTVEHHRALLASLKKHRRNRVHSQANDSYADGSEVKMLRRDIAVHAESLANFKRVKSARFAVQVEPERSHQFRHPR